MQPGTPSPSGFDAVLFDCDGVLVDSETITNGVLRDMLDEAGWRMTLHECMRRFVGHTVASQRDEIEARTGRPLTPEWMQAFYARRNVRLQAEITAIDGIHAALQHLQALGLPLAVASGADRHKVELMLGQLGLREPFGVHIYSGHEVPRSKPFPDVYLAAAAGLGVVPQRCLVVEDTPVGATAGVAAGATVWGFDPLGLNAETLRAAGVARVFGHMQELRLPVR